MNNLMGSHEYYLMYKNVPVLLFNTNTKTVKFLCTRLLPYSIANKEESWDCLRVYCSSRMLMTSREYCKEILTSCNIDDQTDINICIVGKALSFRDNYWIKCVSSNDTWESVNLYKNEFSEDISYTAITGETCSVHIGDRIFTGELTNKGTRPKCYIRGKDGIYLAKSESAKEISAEILSYIILSILGADSVRYVGKQVYGKSCSVCSIDTSESIEMIPCRDILTGLDSPMNKDGSYYKEFMSIDEYNFLLMQIFDYITLNVDRNRDNFALKKVDGKIVGMYPLYDHDSCFKGKSTLAHYFVTGLTFEDTLGFIGTEYSHSYNKIIVPKLEKLKQTMKAQGSNLFNNLGLSEYYDSFMGRIDRAISAKALDYGLSALTRRRG